MCDFLLMFSSSLSQFDLKLLLFFLSFSNFSLFAGNFILNTFPLILLFLKLARNLFKFSLNLIRSSFNLSLNLLSPSLRMRFRQFLIISFLRQLRFQPQALPLLRIKCQHQLIRPILHHNLRLFHGFQHVLSFLNSAHFVLNFLIF